MAANSMPQTTSGRPHAAHDNRALALVVFVPCFAVLLLVGAIARLVPPSLRGAPIHSTGHGSLFHEARTGAYDCVAFALMG